MWGDAMKKLVTSLLVACSIEASGSVCAQDLQKGLEAYNVQDYATALKEWRFLAEQGHAKAQLYLGAMYLDGKGVIQDYKEALIWTRKAAAQGDVSSQASLGLLYGEGKAVTQDNVYAHMWLNIAASRGEPSLARWRDDVAKKMTAAEIAKAQELARECVKKQYKAC